MRFTRAITRLMACFILVVGVGLLAATGCGQPAQQPAATLEPQEALKREERKTEPAAVDQASSSEPAGKEDWDAYFIQGVRVGYARTTQREVDDEGRKLLRIEGESRMNVKRFGQATDLGFEVSTLETPDGKLLSLASTTEMGPQPTDVKGWVEGEKLHLQITTAGKTAESEIDWPAEARGYFAMEQELARQPMQPGERRRLLALMPMVDALGTIELVAADYEVAELLAGSYELLRIDCTIEQPGGKLEETLWADCSGAVLKTYSPLMQMSSYRTTKAVALEKPEGLFDLGDASTVKLALPLKNAHGSKRARYRVELTDGDPASLFESAPGQRVKSTGPNSAEITVEALRPDTPLAAGETPSVSPPTDADREANRLIQSDDPKIVAMAREAAGDEQDPWKAAAALERYVHDVVRAKNYSTAFASASEVAESREGDCTEHAVLLAALARALRIPARVAIGLVYASSEQGFAFHLWTEVYINGRWLPLDGTLGRGGIGAAHLKLADSSLAGDSAYASFLPVAQVLGRLKIEVLEIE
ncbi:MAG TPA: transglutaminase family protein [Pirellulales bacterium]|nr:transglutaminase family protein [Pirellulales bacterium]